ncbi:MAG: hypothetical protein VX000_10820 [Myxococcota bacterium]|nr:hypothetical protein [Myxococcota bacterium]
MLGLLFATTLTAQAADAVAWNWEKAGSVTYRTQTFIQVPNGYRFIGLNNRDARALETAMVGTFTCAQTGSTKKTVSLDCSIDEVVLQGVAVATEQEKLETIFSEHMAVLPKGRIELVLRTDGHIKVFDLEGIEKKWERGNDVHEQLRQLLRRAFAPLGMQAPRDGKDPGRAWRHKGQPAFFDLFMTTGNKGATYGTAGGSVWNYEVQGTSDGRTAIRGEGKANVTTIIEREGGGALGINLLGAGLYRWDSDVGVLDYAEVGLSGAYNASALNIGVQDAYAYAGQVARIRPDGSIAALGELVGAEKQ